MSANSAAKSEKVRPVARKDMTKWQWIRREMVRNKVGYFMVAPFFILFFLFTIIPVATAMVLSLTSFNLLQLPKFVGADNYIRLFLDDDIFIIAVKNTLIFAVVIGPVSYLLSLMIAWFINELSPRIRSIVTLIFYVPALSGGLTAIFAMLFSSDRYGHVNALLIQFQFITEPIQFFQDENLVMPLCIAVALWSSLGVTFLSFIAGLQTIDSSLYEAGAIDGVRNRWQELWYITLPSMKPQLLFGAVMSITSSFGFGAIVTQLAGFPSINYAAHTIVHHLEDYGGQRFEVGYASAIATVLFLLMVGVNLLIKKILSKVGQ